MADTIFAVIKSLIIFVLLVLLLGGAFLSRPTKVDFEKYLDDQKLKSHPSILDKLFGGGKDSYAFNDRLLFVTVQQDGKTTFVGAFSHFWSVNWNGETKK